LHDPTRAADRSRAASKAGRSKPSAEIANVKHELLRVVDGMLAGEIERGRAAVAAQLYGVLLRALERKRTMSGTVYQGLRLDE
jgi:hypothetical protein